MGARTLVRSLVTPAGPGTSHILTVAWSSSSMSTAIEVDEECNPHVEHPAVIRSLGGLLTNGTPLGLVLRTFGDEIAFTLPNGIDIPVKTVRCWFVSEGQPQPRTEAAAFAAFCTDNKTGEPIPPERGVRYADAWPVEIG